MEAELKLDAKYENGVWYDTMGHIFCQIRDLGDTIGLFRPDCSVEKSEPYYIFNEDSEQPSLEKEDAIEEIRTSMRPVPNAAVESPVEYLDEIIDAVGVSNRKLTEEDKRGLMYVRRQVQIREA